ncbi:unannotated protein [freshwater metagenome]|uniref:Unannotated protein n=1 Tax=freshwater metagenome TaxID=449393 RepID=A0A6J7HPM0_9ZZZZ|nr:hypothetical protein [Actinomycetota bacterium]
MTLALLAGELDGLLDGHWLHVHEVLRDADGHFAGIAPRYICHDTLRRYPQMSRTLGRPVAEWNLEIQSSPLYALIERAASTGELQQFTRLEVPLPWIVEPELISGRAEPMSSDRLALWMRSDPATRSGD